MNELENWAAEELGLVEEEEARVVNYENGVGEAKKEEEEVMQGKEGKVPPLLTSVEEAGLVEEKPQLVNIENDEGEVMNEFGNWVGEEAGMVGEEVPRIVNHENGEGEAKKEEEVMNEFENWAAEAAGLVEEEEPQIVNDDIGEGEEKEEEVMSELENWASEEVGLVEEEETQIVDDDIGEGEAKKEEEKVMNEFENWAAAEAGLVEGEEPQILHNENCEEEAKKEEEVISELEIFSAEEAGLVEEEEPQMVNYENGEAKKEEEEVMQSLTSAEEAGVVEEEEPQIVNDEIGEGEAEKEEKVMQGKEVMQSLTSVEEASLVEEEPQIVSYENGEGEAKKEEEVMQSLTSVEEAGLVEEEEPQIVNYKNGEEEAKNEEEVRQSLISAEEVGLVEEEEPQIVHYENGEGEPKKEEEVMQGKEVMQPLKSAVEAGLAEEEPQIVNYENGQGEAKKEEEDVMQSLTSAEQAGLMEEEEPRIVNYENGEGEAKKKEEVMQGKEGKVTPSLTSPLSEGFMQKFRLYETRSKFYMIGRDKTRTYWRVLKIDRTEPSELNIREDSATYTESECSDLLRRTHEGNRSTGGLKFVTTCYGIVGFIKFRGPYYMLLITKRKKIGAICGHTVYAIAKSDMISIPNSFVRSSKIDHRSENRYKKLMCMVDLTKDFFFSYSYHVMRSFQKNMCNRESGQVLYETMFVWNEFLTRGIRTILQNTLWTVALVYGFFKQATLSISGRELKMTLIARRSRHYAGTRYLKRGVNENGRVANDVETEQIVFEDDAEGIPKQVSSVVQNRGSIPLFWSQETSRLIIKPDIILSRRDQTYKATRLHFENLVKRYGNPIIILNLIKTRERRPRESILRAEFANAIEHINEDLSEEERLRFLHWDLHKHSRSQPANVLLLLGKVATYALELTGLFYCKVTPSLRPEGFSEWPHHKESSSSANCHNENEEQNAYNDDDSNFFMNKLFWCNGSANSMPSAERPMFQNGVLRTNCIDCLDRTNVAQYAYGLVALGQQLHALGVIDTLQIDLDDPLAEELMRLYERMGDTLAHQYGGSAAHNKIFSQRRGQWKAAMQSQELFRTLQRYYSNAYMDAEKQNSINVFLGYFQPELDKPEVWEMDSDQYYNMEQHGQSEIYESDWSIFKRSFSDGNIIRKRQSSRPVSETEKGLSTPILSGQSHSSEFNPKLSTAENGVSCSSYTPSIKPVGDFMEKRGRDKWYEHKIRDTLDSSNFVDLDWLSSSGTCEEDILKRSMVINSPIAGLSTDNVVHEIGEASSSINENGIRTKGIGQLPTGLSNDNEHICQVLEDFPDSFVRWVNYGGAMSLSL